VDLAEPQDRPAPDESVEARDLARARRRRRRGDVPDRRGVTACGEDESGERAFHARYDLAMSRENS
jgi:hypothetical protein